MINACLRTAALHLVHNKRNLAGHDSFMTESKLEVSAVDSTPASPMIF